MSSISLWDVPHPTRSGRPVAHHRHVGITSRKPECPKNVPKCLRMSQHDSTHVSIRPTIVPKTPQKTPPNDGAQARKASNVSPTKKSATLSAQAGSRLGNVPRPHHHRSSGGHWYQPPHHPSLAPRRPLLRSPRPRCVAIRPMTFVSGCTFSLTSHCGTCSRTPMTPIQPSGSAPPALAWKPPAISPNGDTSRTPSATPRTCFPLGPLNLPMALPLTPRLFPNPRSPLPLPSPRAAGSRLTRTT